MIKNKYQNLISIIYVKLIIFCYIINFWILIWIFKKNLILDILFK